MSLSVAELRKLRGNAKGYVTRTGNQITLLLKADITLLDLTALEKLSDLLEKADDTFQLHHDDLHYVHAEINEGQYLDESQEHQALVSRVRLNINMLKAQHETTEMMQEVENALSSLEIGAKDGQSPSLLDALPRVKLLNQSFEKSSSRLVIATDVVFQKAREDLSARIQVVERLCTPATPSLSETLNPLQSQHPLPIRA